jgi:hypothetical protein
MRKSFCLAGASAFVVTACAETPDVQMTYYLPKTSVTLVGTRTVACDTKGLYWLSSITPTSNTGPDESVSYPIRFKPNHRALVDTDVAVGLTDDGRLKSINQSATGHGEDVIKAVATLAGGVLPLPALPKFEAQLVKPKPKPKTPTEIACDIVKRRGKDGFLTLTYSGDYEFVDADVRRIPLTEDSPAWAKPVDNLLPPLCEQLLSVSKPAPQVTFDAADKNIDGYVQLRQPAHVKVAVVEAGNCVTYPDHRQIWAGAVLVPQLGKPYTVPIPKGQPFGKQTLELALADSGAITTLHYGRESGAAAAIGSVNDVVGAFPSQTDALNAQSNLIAAQQKNLKCRMDPTNCS